MPFALDYFVYLLVGLIHVIYNYEQNWTMRNLYTLLGAQQGFRHCMTTYPHPGFLEIATAAVWVLA